MTKVSNVGIALRLFIFFLIEIIGLQLFAFLLVESAGYLIGAAVGTFLAAVVANAIAVRVYERGRLEDVGMGWSRHSLRNLLMGTGAAIGAAALVMGIPMMLGMARWVRNPDDPATWGRFALVSIVLLFGAAGEELLFRGYGFQLLMARLGDWAVILPFGVLFAAAHASNLNANWLGLFNTAGWGILFGYAYLRTGELWLPIGLHFGWNWTLPLFGANLSGFTMGLTGYTMEWTAGSLWSGGGYGPEASWLTTVVLIGLAAWIWKAPFQASPRPILGEDRELGATGE